MINIANKAYDGRDFVEDFRVVVDDIPADILEDEEDFVSAIMSGMETNFPKAYAYYKSRKKDLLVPMLGVLKDYGMRNPSKFKFNRNNGDYMSFFKDKLAEYGVSSPAELSERDKPKFFTEVKQGK